MKDGLWAKAREKTELSSRSSSTLPKTGWQETVACAVSMCRWILKSPYSDESSRMSNRGPSWASALTQSRSDETSSAPTQTVWPENAAANLVRKPSLKESGRNLSQSCLPPFISSRILERASGYDQRIRIADALKPEPRIAVNGPNRKRSDRETNGLFCLSCLRDPQNVIQAKILSYHLLPSRRPIDLDAIDFLRLSQAKVQGE